MSDRCHHAALRRARVACALLATFLAAACSSEQSVGAPVKAPPGTPPTPAPVAQAPLPTLTAVTPSTVLVGAVAPRLSITGSGFQPTSTVAVDGAPVPFTLTSASELTLTLPAAAVASTGVHAVTVTNPAPGGGTSNAISVAVHNPVPVAQSLAPSSALAATATVFRVIGSGFVRGAEVLVDDVAHPATVVSSTELTFTPSDAASLSAGTHTVLVRLPAPGGGTSAPMRYLLADVLLDPSEPGPAVSPTQTGVNLQATTQEASSTALGGAFKGVGVGLIRWPGGSTSDIWHWQSGTTSRCATPVYWRNPFDDFMRNVVATSGAAATITVNYGSNADCTAGGDAAEAAAWVAYANRDKGYNIRYWVVGNETYFDSAWDFNKPAHSPERYAERVTNEFYPQMKASDPTIQVGVNIFGGRLRNNWDEVVLSRARFDFVEIHVYPQGGVDDDDVALLTKGVELVASTIATTRAELRAAGRAADTPILLGEFDGSWEYPFGKMQVSITNALFNGMALGEVLKAGVPMATMFQGVSNCGAGGNMSPMLYGWQTWGTSGVFASGSGPTVATSCPGQGVPALTAFPKARVLDLVSRFVRVSDRMIAAQSRFGTGNLRVYAAAGRDGYAGLLFNLDKDATLRTLLAAPTAAAGPYVMSTATYGKAQYDESRTGVWAGVVESPAITTTLPVRLALPPWSVTLVRLRPNGAP